MRSFKFISLTIVIISLLTVVTGNVFATETYGIFTNEVFETYYTDALSADSGLTKLHFGNDTFFAGRISRFNDIMPFITKPGNNYAFYISTHGAPSQFADYYGNIIHANEITGIWHLVFIDACSSAADSSLADAFKTTGYTNRAFLGWYQSVGMQSASDFDAYFWNYVGTRNLRQAALDAAANFSVPGSTPIRMYGDKAWWGWAN